MSGDWIRLNDAYVRIDRLAHQSLAGQNAPAWLVWFEESHIIDCLCNLYDVPSISDVEVTPILDDNGAHFVVTKGRHWPMEVEP